MTERETTAASRPAAGTFPADAASGPTTFAAFAVSRHRLQFDGAGVTTLVTGMGCPLKCRYCLNPICADPDYRPRRFTAEELYETVKIDSLYFEATGGGVTFGGGEPLLQAAFIRDFILYARERGERWRFAVETSLAVPEENLSLLTEPEILIDEFIVDVKDMDAEVYRRYTEREPERMRKNLARLAALCPERITARVPLIPGYNTEAGCDCSERELRGMGIASIDRFRYILPKKKKA